MSGCLWGVELGVEVDRRSLFMMQFIRLHHFSFNLVSVSF